MRSLIFHLRYTVRLLLKSPGFTVTSILILGFGIGMNTAVFSLINSVILRPLPFPHSEQLAELFMPFQNAEYMPFDYEDYMDLCATQRSFESLAVFMVEDDSLTGQGAAEKVDGSFVSSNMFKLTDMPFILGRPFSEDEDRLGGPHVVVLSERFWKRRFNADPKIIGAMLTISGRPLEVIGVAAEQAFEWSSVDVYIPMHLARGVDFHSRSQHYFNCLGRLKYGVNLSQAQAELESIRRGLAEQYPNTDKGYRIRVAPLLSVQTEQFSPTLWLLGAAVGCLFLIAVANIVSLVLARAFERRREISIRAALGASRRRIVVELLVEGALLSSLGAAAGLLIAFWAIDTISLLCREQDLGRFHQIRFDEISMLFFAGITALSSLLFGLCPFWSLTRNNPGFTLKEEAGSTTTIGRNRQRTQTAMVIGQVAVACVLVIGTGLLARSFQMTLTVPLGFNPDHVLTTRFALTDKKYGLGNDVGPDAIAPHKAEILSFYDTLLERARDLPGVASVALNGLPPFEGFFSDPFYIKGSPESEPGQTPVCATQAISADYFRTLQIPLLAGRDFNADDRIGGQPVVIIDEAIAKRFFSKDGPIGKQIEFGGELSGYKRVGYTIVGVVHHVQQYTADRPQPAFQAYFPCAQLPSTNQCLLLRTRLDPHELLPVVRKLFAAIDPDVLVAEVTTYDDLMGQLSTTRRLGVLLTSLFSGSALFLSSVGLYGILAYSVSQRAREIGVRIALGAQATNILRLVIRHGLKIFGTGLAIGILSTLFLSHYIQSVLFGVSGNDPISFGLAILVLGATGVVACLLPALRAMRTDPIKALFEGQSDSNTGLIYKWNMWSPTLSIIAVLIIWPKSWRSILRDIGVIGGTIRSIFLYILIAVIVYPLVILTAPFILSLFGWYKLDLQNFSGLKELLTQAGTWDSVFKSLPPLAGALYFMWLWFSNNLFSVLGEECAWRGFILNRLLPLGQRKAFLISGVLWGLWMQPIVWLGGAYFPSQPVLGGFIMMMMAILIGVVFGWLRLASGSIWPSVCAHSANAAAYHACGFFGAVEQTNIWPGTMSVGVLIPLIFLIAFLILTKRFPVHGSIASRRYANEKIAPQRHKEHKVIRPVFDEAFRNS